jgi:ribose transport system permease protein
MKRIRSIFQAEQASLLLAFIILSAILAFLSPVFLSRVNIMNVLRQSSLVAITGVGICIIILLGEIDLSIGSTQAVVGILAVWILNHFESVFLALIAALVLGALIGLINGLLVTKARINSLIATLGMMAILRGTAMVTTQAKSIQAEVESFMEIGTGYLGSIPIPVIITILVFILFYYILNYTALGRYIYAIGGNSEAANLSGIPVERIKVIVFIIGGMLAALSAFILASRLFSGQPNAGTGFELEVIAAVILGGVSLAGGQGTLAGAIIGILILGILSNGLILLNVSSFYHDIARGLVIILAVYLDERRKRGLSRELLRMEVE